MVPIRFQVVGEEDYAFDVEIRSTGEYLISGGTCTSERPRTGTLTGEQKDELLAAITEPRVPQEHPRPEGVEAFEAHLTVGEKNEAVVYPFREGALEKDKKLRNLVRVLEKL